MSSNIIKYHGAFNMSQTLLDITGIDEFPLNFDDLFSKKKRAPIFVSSMKDYNAWVFSKHPSQRNPVFVSDAKCFYYPDRDAYMILYNEARPGTRIRFSLAHELGHIVLGHLNNERTEISRGGVDDPTYYALEGAANTFAGNLLAPPILIDDFLSGAEFNVERISTRFNISPSATKDYRAEDYKYWKTLIPSKHEKAILKRCHSGLHKQACIECGAAFEIKGALFCPICGCLLDGTHFLHQLRTTGKGAGYMEYPGIELDEKDRAIECPVCHNTELYSKGRFCIICGNSLVNLCSAAQEPFDSSCQNNDPLPGNARYCPFCGAESTFFQKGILPHWNENSEEIDNDGELPF